MKELMIRGLVPIWIFDLLHSFMSDYTSKEMLNTIFMIMWTIGQYYSGDTVNVLNNGGGLLRV